MATAYQVTSEALSRELDGEVLVLDLRSSHYFGMTGTAARIWSLVEDGIASDAIVETLAAEYNAPAATIREDVDAFIADLVDRKLIEARP